MYDEIYNDEQVILTPINGQWYNKHVAAELLCISPAAYRMLQRYEAIILPREKTIRELMLKSQSDSNLGTLLESLKQQ